MKFRLLLYDIIDHKDRRIGNRMAKKYLTFDDLSQNLNGYWSLNSNDKKNLLMMNVNLYH